MSTIKNSGLDKYGAEPFEQQQFGTAGVEGVNRFQGSIYGAYATNFAEIHQLLFEINYLQKVTTHRHTDGHNRVDNQQPPDERR